MASASQTAGIAAYRASRAARAALESRLLDLATTLVALRQRLADAEAVHDDAMAAQLHGQIDAIDQQWHKLRDTLPAEQDRGASAQQQALGLDVAPNQDGFDLLSARHPLLLLPVRLEARFAWGDGRRRRFSAAPGLDPVLLVRVFPDEIHEDSHEPELTPTEARWLVDFEKTVDRARDQPQLVKAWGDLIAGVGAARAGWIAQLAAARVRPSLRPSRMSRPIRARLLPDRWVAFAELESGGTVMARAASPVREPLDIGLASGTIDWMRNFDEALAAGMALTIPLPPETTAIRRLVVVGARGTFDYVETAKEFEQLLASHQYTRGLELLSPGTPTNSVPGERAGYTSRPDFDSVFAVDGRRMLINGGSNPLCSGHDETDGSRMARALGIDAATFGFVRGADGLCHVDGRRIRQLLTAAIQRRVTALVEGIFSSQQVDEILSFALERVDPLGPFAALRVGTQPYGLLPVPLRSTLAPVPGTFPDDARRVLDALRQQFWEPAVAATDYVGMPRADPGQTLINILRQDAVAREIALRPVFGPELSRRLAAQLGVTESADLEARREALRSLLQQLGAAQPEIAPIVDMLHVSDSVLLTSPLVEPPGVGPLSVQSAKNYLELVAAAQLNDLAASVYPGERPDTLLFAIARLAVLESADVAARELLQIGVPGIDMSRWDSEDVPSVFVDRYGTPQRRLDEVINLPDPLSTIGNTNPVWFHLSAGGLHKDRLQFWRDLLRELKGRPPELLDEILRASFGTFSHRLDAWYTGLATDDLLGRVREDLASQDGLNIGAWGLLENLRLAPRRLGAGNVYSDPSNGGFIHAPSASHGAAAAVLRSIHLGHAASGHGDAFSVDLSSERVRHGTELLEGIRAGQPLGALLGYRIERALLTEGLPQLIPAFRDVAPLVANRLTPGTDPVETVAASNVVDGLVLLEKAGYDGSAHATPATLWQSGALGPLPTDPLMVDAVQRVLALAEDLVDSVADLALAESVYQAVQGNTLRAGAAVDSVSGAPVPPTELDVVRTPRTGVGVTHRLLTLFGEPVYGGDGSWVQSPRASAEPRLDAAAQAILPPPDAIGIRVVFHRANGDVSERVETTLGELYRLTQGTDAAALRLAALDLVAQADPHDTPQRTALEVRLAALAAEAFADPEHNGPIELVFARDAGWDAARFGIVETLEIARAFRDLLGQARPLSPSDFAHPEAPPSVTIHPTDLETRRSAAAGTLQTVAGMLAAAQTSTSTVDLRRALFAADAFGIGGASPDSLRDAPKRADQEQILARLLEQAKVAATEIAARLVKVTALAVDDTAGRLQTLFGDAFKVLPLLVRGGTDIFARTPAGADAAAARSWCARAARVRKGVAVLDASLAYAAAVSEAAGTVAASTWQVAQLPGTPGERWAALPATAGTKIPGGRVSIVAAAIGGTLKQDTFGGLFVDEWVDVIPSAEETTSVAFHCDAPSSAAPQVMLLGVPPPNLEGWTAQGARELVIDALALAQLRLVDGDVLPGLGQLLPALFSLENPAGEAAALGVDALTDSVVTP